METYISGMKERKNLNSDISEIETSICSLGCRVENHILVEDSLLEAQEEVEQSAENIFPAENDKLPWFDAAHHGMLGDGSNFTIDMESEVVETLGNPNMSPRTTFSVGYEAETVRVTVTYGREQYMDVEQVLLSLSTMWRRRRVLSTGRDMVPRPSTSCAALPRASPPARGWR